MTYIISGGAIAIVYQRLGGQSTMTNEYLVFVVFEVYQRLGGQSTMTKNMKD